MSEKTCTTDTLVSIIVINYNGNNLVIECIESIKKTKKIAFEVILIDNASSDNSLRECKKKFLDLSIIENDTNLGLGARNQGLKIAKGNYIVFLDFDTIVDPNWLENLLNCFQKNGNGLYQPKLLEKDKPNIINSAGNMLNIFGLAYSRGKGEEDVGQYDQFSKISYTSGACTFSSRQIIDKIGDIDDIFFAYHDDVDYGWRAAILRIPSFYEPKSIVYHFGSRTLKWSPKKFFLLERNRWICLLTLYSQKTIFKIFPYLILIEIGISFFFISKGMFLEKIKAFFSLLKIYKKLEERKKILQEKKTLDDKEIIKIFVDDFYLPSKNGKNNQSFSTKLIKFLSHSARNIINI